ncbi:MAG: hypothetical protein A2189_03510 [Paenibacillus sp. RIFOXYA1_FULL_44_5]|nr:MAG: hypothetical protein A2189_03510 [Paenibacillus sp. RIFOXYA1_FULL_44_5]
MIKLWGIPIRIHPLFTLLMLLSVVTGYFLELSILFGIVFIHELGHIAVAKSFRWQIKEIRLLPFGGVAVTDEAEKAPGYQELLVAAAGPLQNGWMIVLTLLLQKTGVWGNAWSEYFIRANAMIALFNLLPIFPLDGGRIVKMWLSYNWTYYRALLITSIISLLLSFMMIVAAFIRIRTAGIEMNLLIIGTFLLFSNFYEWRSIPYYFIRFLMNRETRMDHLIHKGTLAQPIVVKKYRTIMEIMHLFMREKYHLIYVMDDHGKVHAVLPEQRLLYTLLIQKNPGSAVSELFM